MGELFLKDLNEILENNTLLSSRMNSTGATVRMAEGIIKALPVNAVNKIARKAGSIMRTSGKDTNDSQAALYGINATFRNRKNMNQLLANLLDGMF
jgi:hypothetical protein